VSAAAALFILMAVTVGAMVADPAMAGKASRTGVMSLCSGATFTRVPTATVDSAVPQATSMRVMNSGGTWSPWMPYAASTPWTLIDGDGDKAVQAQYRLSTGKLVSLTDAITLDGTPPLTTSDYGGVLAPRVTVALSALDLVSGVTSTSYRVDGGAWRQGSTADLLLGHKRRCLAAGPHTLEFFSIDLAGNIEPVRATIVTLGF
jgi:hypothetical protein